MCLAESAGRATPKDWDIVRRLEEKAPGMDRKEVFDELLAAKNDVSGGWKD